MQLVNPEIMESPITENHISDEEKAGLVHNLLKKRNRNNPCICLSGKKFKYCCLSKVEMMKKQMNNKSEGIK